jgi:CheY-like chemotaxis protein
MELEQIVTNFVLNARDASPAGREVLVRVASRPGDDGRPAEIALSVVDRGTGIHPNDLGNVFDPFFTTKDVGGGTGLGLSSVHGIARSLGGTVEVDSTLGAGSTFTALIPVAPAPVTVPAAVADEAKRAVVVVVDDMAPALEATRTVLESAGHAVFGASSGNEALEIVSSLEAVDLLVADVVMPGMSGFQLAERVRALLPELPVIFMSGLVADLDDRSIPGAAPVSFVGKPYRPADLVAEVAEAIAG